jgi:hypothetical protein
MGAVSKALKHVEQTRGHEMLGLCKRGYPPLSAATPSIWWVM